MGLRTLMTNIQTAMEAVSYTIQDEDGKDVSVPYFDNVFIGMPQMIPMEAANVCVIEAESDPNFYYVQCPTLTKNDTDVVITSVSKGFIGEAQLLSYDIADAVKAKIYSDETFGGACIDSTVEQCLYGDIVSGTEGKQLQAASRIMVRCRMG